MSDCSAYAGRFAPGYREARARYRDAQRLGVRCGHCGDAIPDDQPVHLWTFSQFAGWDRWSARAPVCTSWWPRRKWTPPDPCVVCGRSVMHALPWTGHVVVCSARCADERYNGQHRQIAEPRPCASCGEVFTPSRSDALRCSAACRQRAYRRRTTLRQDGDPQPGRSARALPPAVTAIESSHAVTIRHL
jgi:hypothetical protein